MGYAGLAAVLIAVSAGVVFLIRKNLAQRERARALRTMFIEQANDLVAKPEFPDAHARMLIDMSSLPEGWATRLFVARLAKHLFFGQSGRTRAVAAPKLDQVPHGLRRKYVLAILAFALSDSYRCVIFGHIFRATNSWLNDAVKEPKSDVDAQATRNVIDQVAQMPTHRKVRQRELAAC